ncbi:ABC transporter ATP-binding protein [Agrobacterium radiobacter]|jgi:putrescine transport system ATP-binding protein|uniref:Spermidine/putrescine import ATP-binding protein PotA n=4 Tax=Agrobacterium tumefaciens complex TaxID=1183400 RepID=A0AAW8LT67_AGRTU|nr:MULTISPECIES: ABC transporter ATP-binding protein [Agrobacterium tumefaciens complex]MCP2135690.1 putrescine transport system ATP-binding protein [Rhizobium sp. SLBN-94]TGE81970.1 ABC transporter ATP-binding protein [Rhizobium sp. SEMIA 439]AYM04490.1 putrescine transport system ATP-binding protein [Agrobacterium tumefaciens]AYM80127.1 putrescine transport system ATP-binding protein [Agrobacterium tumefaciens]EHH08008.1 spermidine/putrescine ABC transporter ATPase subunit [Agrobacterium tum
MAKTLGPVKRKFSPWDNPDAVPFIRFENVTKRFGDFVAVNNLTLDIYEREFFSLLGPSGCGKTTLMRMLAGFEEPTEGRILLQGKDISGVPPYKRPTNMMFQSYALFPHMSVEKNVAFGLEQDGLPKADVAARVEEMLRLVKLTEFAKRKPSQLSGGQRQRVALARSLAKRPKVLLLDEPLGALDKKLREETQFELMDIQTNLGLTFLIVTHDQEEAMTVSDRIAVMDKGNVVQVATPAEIYEAPNSRYVADFIGDINIFDAKVVANASDIGKPGLVTLDCEGLKVAVEQECAAATGSQVAYAIRPEKVRISLDQPADSSVNSAYGEVWDIGYLGDFSVFIVKLADGRVIRAAQANVSRLVDRPITFGDMVWLNWRPDSGLVLTR